MRTLSKILTMLIFVSISTTLFSQTWNGIGVHKLTYRNGAVAIGTDYIPESGDVAFQDISNYKLFVCGGILADEWLVPNTTWCDYVFQDTYDLLSLKEVADHIDEYGHLHRTPSAAEIKENGLEMKAATLNQQEKIEEIYLHLIELNERLKAVEAENAKLRAQLNQPSQPVQSRDHD